MIKGAYKAVTVLIRPLLCVGLILLSFARYLRLLAFVIAFPVIYSKIVSADVVLRCLLRPVMSVQLRFFASLTNERYLLGLY